MSKSKLITLVIAIVLVVGMLVMFYGETIFTSQTAEGPGPDPSLNEVEYSCQPGDFPFENDHLPAVLICIAGYGVIVTELYPEYAPITVANFIDLVDRGFYDGLTLHRIMEGFMMQGGCPYGQGIGNSGEFITGEFAANGHNNPIHHERGVLSMARQGHDMNSASSQFFIIDGEAWWLDNEFAGFGRVIYGMEVVDRITTNSNPIDDNGTIRPAEQPVISEMRVWNRP